MKQFSLTNILSRLKWTSHYRRSYSQEGEDMILADLLQGKPNGFYVDIGAFHPSRFSNTKFFYDSGWRGINIEPSPEGIREFISSRPRDTNLNLGVSNTNSRLSFYVFREAALNTFDKERVRKLENDTPYKHVEVQSISVKRLETILGEYAADTIIDFMNIDVEWHEMEVLKSNDWGMYRPRFLLVEILDFSLKTLNQNPIHKFLTKEKYEFLCKTPRTCFYKDRDS
jgi:FkbM family methyltransferase